MACRKPKVAEALTAEQFANVVAEYQEPEALVLYDKVLISELKEVARLQAIRDERLAAGQGVFRINFRIRRACKRISFIK